MVPGRVSCWGWWPTHRLGDLCGVALGTSQAEFCLIPGPGPSSSQAWLPVSTASPSPGEKEASIGPGFILGKSCQAMVHGLWPPGLPVFGLQDEALAKVPLGFFHEHTVGQS